MKYWNKSKRYRESQWHKVTSVVGHDVHELKLWCQRQESLGKFYCKYPNPFLSSPPFTVWWFERLEDASWFILKWSA